MWRAHLLYIFNVWPVTAVSLGFSILDRAGRGSGLMVGANAFQTAANVGGTLRSTQTSCWPQSFLDPVSYVSASYPRIMVERIVNSSAINMAYK